MALEQRSITSLFHLFVWLKLNVEIPLSQGHRRNGLATYLTSICMISVHVFFIIAQPYLFVTRAVTLALESTLIIGCKIFADYPINWVNENLRTNMSRMQSVH